MKSSFQGLFIAFLGTLVIFSLVKTDIYKKIPKFRFLSDRTLSDIREDMCSKSSSNLLEFYKTTGPNYEYEPLNNNKVLQKIIKDFINNSSSSDINKDDVKEYFSKSSLYIFILVLFIFLIILWIPYIICVCFKCCCCIPESCLRCPKIYVFICLVLCALTLINCFIGYSKNGSIVDGVYGLGCSILKVEQHLVEGDEYKSVKPYWIGLQAIMDKLQETSKNISSLSERGNLTDKFQSVTQLHDSFKKELEVEYSDRSDSKVRHPSPDNKTLFIPPYLFYYGPAEENPNTFLGEIYIENDYFYNFSSEGISLISSIINTAIEKTSEINKTIIEINNNLKTNIDDIDNSIASNINKNEETFNDVESISRRFMNILFSFNLIVTIAVGIALFFLFICKKGLLLLCVSWFILYIFMLLTFFLGAIFGLLGSFIQDASGAIYYIINNLNELESLENQSQDIAEICLKGNGSLASSSLIPDFNLSIIDNVYTLESLIDEKKEIVNEFEPISVQENEKKYNEVLNSKNNLIYLVEVLEKVKQYTDKNDKKTFLNQSSKFQDIWEINEGECAKGYSYLDPNKSTNENKYCLIITEWTYNQIEERYNENDYLQDILKYYTSIINYMKDNTELISIIKSKNEDFRNYFLAMKAKDIELLDETKEFISPLRKSYEEIVGKNSIFEILNCKFLKRDVNKIMEELYNSFGKTFKTTSNLFLLISFYELAMTLFILFIMKAFSNKTTSSMIER